VAAAGRDRDQQCDTEAGLNTIENWNQGNGVICFGNGGELSSNRRDHQELSMLALHLAQSALVYVNTLLIQDMLAEPEWADVLTPEDKRGLTPLFWTHLVPYGEVRLDMSRRLAIRDAAPSWQP
jgi:hypothetical protein